MRFRAGDYVRCIGVSDGEYDVCNISEGRVYIVNSDVEDEDRWLNLESDDDGDSQDYLCDDFELFHMPDFKVGDAVRCEQRLGSYKITPNKRYRVISRNEHKLYIMNDVGSMQWYAAWMFSIDEKTSHMPSWF